METIIVMVILGGAVYSLIRLFKKQADGQGGCACDGKCRQCPTQQDEDSCS